MKRRISSILKMVLVLSICMGLSASTVRAANLKNLSLPVTIETEGNVPKKAENYSIRIQKEGEESPMPGGSDLKEVGMQITGAGTQSFPEITYDKVGMYQYKVWQEPGTNKNATYDKSIYHVTVYVTYTEDGEDLELNVSVYKEGVTEKQAELRFVNTYKEDVKTGDGANTILYASVALISGVAILAVILIQYKKRKAD